MIEEFRPDKKRIARLRRILGRAVRDALQDQKDDLAGFALVTWDNRGNGTSAFYADSGPIGESLVALYVHEQLVKHAAYLLVKNGSSHRETGE